MIPIQQILVRCTEEQLESILSSCQTIMSHMEFAPVTHPYSSLEITSSTGKFTAWIALCLRSLQPAHRAKHSAIRTRWWSELGGATLLFLDWSQALLVDGHPYLLYDFRRSILFDCYYLGVPNIVLQVLSSPELRRSGFAGVHKFRIVAQYRSPSNP